MHVSGDMYHSTSCNDDLALRRDAPMQIILVNSSTDERPTQNGSSWSTSDIASYNLRAPFRRPDLRTGCARYLPNIRLRQPDNYEELAGYGFVATNARDNFGDNIGGIGSAISIPRATSKKLPDGSYSGSLYGLPDRGWNTQGEATSSDEFNNTQLNPHRHPQLPEPHPPIPPHLPPQQQRNRLQPLPR
jgi:hypothetical protein